MPTLSSRLVVIVCVSAVIPLVGCGSASSGDRATLRLTDDVGRTVDVHAPVNRIVTMAPNLTEITFAAGAGDRLAGVTTADDFPPEVETLPRFSAVGVDFEAVTALQPDIVVATDQVNSTQDAATFETLSIPVYYFSFSSLDDIFQAISVIGKMAGTEQRATTHSETLAQAVKDLAGRTASAVERPRVLFLISADPLFGFGKGSYVHEIIEAAGGTSVSAEMDTVAPVFSDEYVIEQQPDVIVGAFPTNVDAAELLRLHPAWGTVPAIRMGRVYTVDPDLVLRPGPRVVEGAFRIALALHPDIFAEDPSIIER